MLLTTLQIHSAARTLKLICASPAARALR
jgi:hypothetical protein